MAGHPLSYQLLIGRTTNRPALAIAVPVLDENGATIGVASIVSHLDDISKEVLGQEGSQSGAQTFILDQHNQVIAHPDAVVANSLMDMSSNPAVAAVRAGKRGQYEYEDEQGTQWLAYLTRLDNDWIIITQVESQKALAPLVQFQIISGVITFAGLLLLVLSATWMIRRSFQPIAALTEAVKAITAGDLEREARVDRQDEIGHLAASFNNMTRQQRQLIATLEQRVESRTRMIEASAEVSRRLSTILNLNHLVQEVVTQLQDAFGYYHVHIYLLDESGNELVMAGGTGKVGQTMLAQGHRIPMGRGLVGRAAQSNQPVLVGDINQDPGFIPNPLLPETRSELAVPIANGTQVLGVLDVQQAAVAGLGQADAQLIQSVANQVAIAVQNARAYSHAQHEAQRQAVISSISQSVQRSSTIDEVLQVAVRELGQALGAQRSSVELSAQRSSEKKN
jgi:putative methionine-R-sulfoxide reductase with GAF domain